VTHRKPKLQIHHNFRGLRISNQVHEQQSDCERVTSVYIEESVVVAVCYILILVSGSFSWA